MSRFLSPVLAVALLLGLGTLAVLALPSQNAIAPVSAAAPGLNPNAPAVAGNYNAIGLPLDNGIASASALLTNINSTTGGTAVQILKWDPGSGYAVYDPADLVPVDFALKAGDPVMVLMQGTGLLVYSMVGSVPPPSPAPGSVRWNLVGGSPCRYNFITLPLDQGAITMASQLATAIGNVSQVLSWDPTTAYTVYDPADLAPADFPVKIGYPYFVCTSASKTWP
jgi:hypothetical protein